MKGSAYRAYSDPELVAMCLDGDVRAWETLMWRYRRLIFSIPTKFGLPQYDALDVFQTVCLKLLEHLHEVKDDRKISTWLATTTTRQCLAILTTRQKEFGQQPEVDEPLDPAGTLEDIRLLAERYQQLRDAVEELPARCRSLIEILYLDVKKYNYEQINEKLGIPVASIGPIRARCLNRLRKILNERGIK